LTGLGQGLEKQKRNGLPEQDIPSFFIYLNIRSLNFFSGTLSIKFFNVASSVELWKATF